MRLPPPDPARQPELERWPTPTVDYLYFLRARTRFIRHFYTEAAAPFVEVRRKIEASEEPFDRASGEEDSEPPFLNEWMEAGEALDVLGQASISMLSTSLHLYIRQWITELIERAGVKQLTDLGIGEPEDDAYKPQFKSGWISGYRAYCARLGVDWNAGPSDLTLLEQIVLARNTVQHSDDITSVRARQSKGAKYPSGFFADALELAMFDRSSIGRFVRPVRLDISQDKLFAALDEVEGFCEWLNGQHPMRRL